MTKKKIIALAVGGVLAVTIGAGVILSSFSKEESDITKIQILRYKDSNDHKGRPHGKPDNSVGKTSQCFAYLSKDAKWKTVEPWVINPTNVSLDGNFVFTNTSSDITKWETAAGADILGNGTTTSDVLEVDLVSMDGKNEVYFGNIEQDGVIAMTVVWGRFGGPPFARELLEWDMVFDEVDFDWSSTGEAGKMDFENIMMHELGHAMGMGHPEDSCLEETMYRFADFGETKKRTLEAGDIAGIDKLY